MSFLKQVGLKEIAYELGVSVNTVSRALRDCDDISLEMKKKVRQKAIEMGYSPNSVEEFVKKDYKKNIAFVGPTFTNSYFTLMCNELLKFLDQEKYDFNVIISKKNFLDEEDLKRCILQRVDAIITFIEPLGSAIEIAKLYKIPMVLVGRQIENADIDQIFTDDYLGGVLAGRYLIEKQKCKKLCFVTFNSIECAKRRYDGFLSIAKENGLTIDSFEVDDKNQIDSNHFINEGYDGIFCFNDELAYILLYSASTHGDEMNEKFSHVHIVGYDALAPRILGLKKITSINSNYCEIAKTTIDLVISRLEKNEERVSFKTISFPVSLNLRKHH